MQSLTGQVAVVTGAGQGIGRAVATVLAQEGAAVAIVDLEEDRAEQTATDLRADVPLLFARAGRPHCPVCGEPITRQSPQQIVDRLLELPDRTRFQVLAPVIKGRKGEYVDLFTELQTKGFSRARVDGEVKLDVEGQVTQRSVLDALEARYPMLRGTIRDHVSHQRRAFVRFFACEEDFSHQLPDAPLPDAVVSGAEPFWIIGAVAGG